ncbi:hypothetical protein QYF36_003055 [Acer negundo]|nr:hypothetical protein QYF36_003055 [Acer negundo]
MLLICCPVFVSLYWVPLQGSIDSSRLDVKQRIVDEAEKIKSWKSPDITESSQLKALRLLDSIAASKVKQESSNLVNLEVQELKKMQDGQCQPVENFSAALPFDHGV